MPAMPKEKTSPIPLTECNFNELKMKEQLVGSSTTPVSVSTQTTTTPKLISHQQQTIDNQQISMQQTKLYTSSSCNDICQINNTMRTSSVSSVTKPSSLRKPGIGGNETETVTTNSTISTNLSTTTKLLNGSTTLNLFNSKNNNHQNNKINGTMNMSIMTGLTTLTSSKENICCCNEKNKINNVLTSTAIAAAPQSPTVTSLLQTNPPVTIFNTEFIMKPTTTATELMLPATSSSSSPSSSSPVSISRTQQQTSKTPILLNTTASTSTSSLSCSPSSSTSTTAVINRNALNNSSKGNGVIPPKKSAKDFVFGKIIGEGSFSTVCLAKDVHTNREYAIKICYKPHILREKKQEYVRREREVMHIMNNVPGFVNLHCTFQDYRNLYFVMTLAKNGDLLPYINKVGSFDLDCTRHYAAELVLAIENMHKRGVIHRDLKPENILLDENMHTLIADFGSAKIFDVNQENDQQKSQQQQQSLLNTTTTTTTTSAIPEGSKRSLAATSTTTTQSNQSPYRTTNHFQNAAARRARRTGTYDDDDDDVVNENDEDDEDSPQPIRRRKGSFVGTAQYVSPEVLQGEAVERSADLWALGCIIYQMISGLPPFRGGSDYLIFREIMNLNLVFPEGFDKDAENLVRDLLKLKPSERLGANDQLGKYTSIRSHKFFNCIDWNIIRKKTPPQIYPYLPGLNKDEELRSHYRVPDNLEPGLDNKQLTRLLGLELSTSLSFGRRDTVSSTSSSSPSPSSIETKTEPKNIFNLTESEKQKRLDAQKLTDKWHSFSDGEIILKKGFINKRKGLFARKRMLLLTTGPRLIYIDPVQMVKKGEIPWSPQLRVEPKNFKIFFVHTPNRTYYLEDPEGYALEWVNAIEDVRQKTYGDKS